ncbi:hypothetical protein TWF102_007802 [Orbilia oligospora]|uniref:F-box domain-containing protein n=1 Tax=Orbilia oligospora TaxID=2813651 RepID=A0A7C8J4G8_ORBOL|nr:hypothetical protein TWF102_007802 [Orbilia oligospora]KAF3116653.1 hypothetical protein TWF103_008415 [Orbilia oligospora]KAF3135176.1 hypothetical protein TWF703_006089 [Orbilia oligospora]
MHQDQQAIASLPSLPQELIDQISSSIDDQDDLLSLRLTCKSSNHIFRDPHLTSIYQCRRIFLVPRSLQNLLKIAKDPSGVGDRVKYLQIADSNPYCEILSWPPSEFDSERTILRRSAKEKLSAAGSEFRGETEEMISSGKDIKMLVEIFENLKNLRGIEIEKFSELPKRWELNLLYPSMGLGPGNQIPEFMSLIKTNDIKAIGSNPSRKVITAALKSGIKSLRKLSNTYSTTHDAFSHNWFEEMVPSFSMFSTAFPNLRYLEISVYFTTMYRGQPLPAGEKNVCDWLEGLGDTLEELRFEYLIPATNLEKTTMLPNGKGLPRLKVLQLRSILIDIDNLSGLLESCKDNLKELKILSCRTLDIKEGVFKLLKFLKKKVKRLRIFEAGFKDEKVTREGSYPVRIHIYGDWESYPVNCMVWTKVQQKVFFAPYDWEIHTRQKFDTGANVVFEIDENDTAEGFWRELLDGKWDEWDAMSPNNYYYDRRLEADRNVGFKGG